MQIFGEEFCFFSQKLPKMNPKLLQWTYLVNNCNNHQQLQWVLIRSYLVALERLLHELNELSECNGYIVCRCEGGCSGLCGVFDRPLSKCA